MNCQSLSYKVVRDRIVHADSHGNPIVCGAPADWEVVSPAFVNALRKVVPEHRAFYCDAHTPAVWHEELRVIPL